MFLNNSNAPNIQWIMAKHKNENHCHSTEFFVFFFIFPLKLWMFITFLGFIRICGCLLGVYENMCVNGTKKHSDRVEIHNIHTYTHTHTPKRNDDKMSNTKQEIENDLLLLFLLLRTITYRVSVFIFRKKIATMMLWIVHRFMIVRGIHKL